MNDNEEADVGMPAPEVMEFVDKAYEDGRMVGIREVVEYKCDECSTPGFVHLIVPIAQLKEWGIGG